MKAVLLGAMLLASAPASAEPIDLHLLCRGSGNASTGTEATATSRDWSTGQTVETTVSGSENQGFQDDVRIDIADQGGRIRLPAALLPPIRGGKNGWFELRKVEATRDEITAVATINLLNKIKLRLDRLSGAASFTTRDGNFHGRCIAYKPETEQRAF